MSVPQMPLGQKSAYCAIYQPDLLYRIPRQLKRDEIGVSASKTLPFQGVDIWHAYEVSWLNPNGKPMVAVARIVLPCDSQYLVESKSLKLYFNSFNQTKFASAEAVRQQVEEDLTQYLETRVIVEFLSAKDLHRQGITEWSATCLDDLDIATDVYTITPDFLHADTAQIVEESLCSHLLKSNCLVTEQPDWGSVYVQYCGAKIEPAGLLKYWISFRCHNEFHEQCIERIFVDIMQHCQPEKLTVYGCYTRRGGLDSNPLRSTEFVDASVWFGRLFRQ